MKFNLGENYKIETDGLNVIVKKKYIVNKKVEDESLPPQTEEVFRTIGYFSTVKQAFINILNTELLEDEVIEEMGEVLERIKEYETLVSSINI